MARNKLAGTKTGKSKSAKYYQDNPEARKKKKEYDTKYHSTPERRKYRSELIAENRKRGTHGNHDGKDFDHATGKMEKAKTNRGRNSKSKKSTKGDRRARG
jgi:hypothetical protein